MMQLPGMLDWFGWCTWDAFYFEVHPQGIKDGLKRLVQFLIHSDAGDARKLLFSIIYVC